MCEAQN